MRFLDDFRDASLHALWQEAHTRRDFMTQMGRLSLGAALLPLVAGCGGSDNNSTNNQPYSGTLTRANDQMRAVIEQYLAFGAPPIYTLTPQQARMQPTIADAVKALLVKQGKSTAPQPVGSVADGTIPGPASQLPARVYTPSGTGPFPVLVYFHGGGWVVGTIDVYDASARALCNAAGCVVVSVEYRKGPENKFPAAHEDAYAATQYVLNNTALFNGDPARVAVGGESAGGNMAAAVCLLARDRKGKMPVYQLLIYPVANNDLNDESYQENVNAFPLSKAAIQYFLANYLTSQDESSNPLLSLVKATFDTSLPPATVITDDIDPLRTEGQLLADKLQAAGITVRRQNYEGVTHEFFGTGAVVDVANQAVAFAADGLKSVFQK